MFLGIDLGSTALKAAVFDDVGGGMLAEAEHRLPLEVGDDGRREQDSAEVLRALRTIVASLRERIGDRWRSLRGVGLAAQGGSTILADRETGRALTPLILWNDTRAFGHYREIAAAHPPAWWRSFSLRDEPGMGLARIVWLRGNQPALFEGNPIYAGAGDYVYFALTRQWRQDACHALQSGCYDAVRNTLTERPLKGVGVTRDFFPLLRQGHQTHPLCEEAAALLELPEGIPVAGPYSDNEAGYLSVRHASRMPMECPLGTAWLGNFLLPAGSRGRNPFQLCMPSPSGEGQLVVMPLLTGNTTWDWALETFVHREPSKAFEMVTALFAERLLPPCGLVALPWLNRPNALRPAHTGSAGFFGIGPSTTPGDLCRAVAAGMCFEFARVLGPVARTGAVDSLVLCGGAAKSLAICSLLARLFAPLPVHRVVESGLMGTRGCLYAFDPSLSAAPTVPVPAPSGMEGIEEARDLYLETFERLCGRVPTGKPYSLSPKKK